MEFVTFAFTHLTREQREHFLLHDVGISLVFHQRLFQKNFQSNYKRMKLTVY